MTSYAQPAWRVSMRVRFDFNDVMAESVGARQGIASAEIDAHAARCRAADAAIKHKRADGELEWMGLPYQDQWAALASRVSGAESMLCRLASPVTSSRGSL